MAAAGGSPVPGGRTSVAIIGAGPYGLATAAYLRAAGIPFRIFGQPMEFWRRHMPAGMLLRSRRRATHIAHPGGGLAIDDFMAATRREIPVPTPLEDFIAYGEWFQQQVAPQLDARLVTEVSESSGGGFRLTLEGSEELAADRVVVATGLSPFPRHPPELDSLPSTLVSHSSEHSDLSGFAGRDVIVVGLGQSALESAALLREHGARVQVVGRAAEVLWLAGDIPGLRRRLRKMMLPPTDVGGRVTGWVAAVPDVFRRLPVDMQELVAARCIPPAGAAWLPERLRDVAILTGTRVVAATEDAGRVRVKLSNGAEQVADHLLLGTGYSVDVARYTFLSEELRGSVDSVGGQPRLGPGFEASVPGLYFVGASAAARFGPLMRFVVGTWYAAPTVAAHLRGSRPAPLRASFPRGRRRQRGAGAVPARAYTGRGD
jgi:thioredoxin reductase